MVIFTDAARANVDAKRIKVDDDQVDELAISVRWEICAALPGMETTAVGTTSAGSLLNPASSFGLCTFKISLKYLCSVGISAGDKISFRQ